MGRMWESVDEKMAAGKICVEKVGNGREKVEFEHESVDDRVESV